MNTQAAISAITAFIVGAGGSYVVVAIGGAGITTNQWIGCAVVGAIAAAKDLRTLYKLPPVDDTKTPPTP